MGNVVESVSKHKTEVVLFGGLVATVYHLHRERQEKEELKGLLRTAL